MSPAGRSRRIPGVTVRELTSQASLGVHDVWYGSAKVVVKRDAENLSTVANEFICTLGLPVPMGDAGTLDELLAWVSAEVALDDISLPAADLAEVARVAPFDLAGIFVFDIWVNNHDRSDENILYHPRVGVWAIDHEQALAGPSTLHPDHLLREISQVPQWDLVPPPELNVTYVTRWIEDVRSVKKNVIENTLREAHARRLVNDAQRKALATFLSQRSAMISDLVNRAWGRGGGPWLTEPRPGTSSNSQPT